MFDQWLELQWESRDAAGNIEVKSLQFRHNREIFPLLYLRAEQSPNCHNVKAFHCKRQQIDMSGVTGFDGKVDEKLNVAAASVTAENANWQRSTSFGGVSCPAPEDASVLERDGEAPAGS